MPISNSSMPSVPDGVQVDDLTLDTVGLLITARTMAAQACCQACGRASARVHSRYWRTFKDLPWQGAAIGQAFTRFTPQECRNYLAAAGYENDLAVAT
ncbi:hypothetical protein BY998_1442 [Methylobacterium sp. B4]|nr:hypothetical protein BY998_1442 [Methylobacterium sp. B4]